MEESKPHLLTGILGMKCPNCRKGHMFSNKSFFPLKKLMHMPEQCPVCGQKFELEVGFYYGTGYVSYALSVALTFINFIWYGALIGLSYEDYSFFYCLITSTVIVVLLQPWLMRISRVLYLYMFVKYGKGASLKTEE
jgi:hypothetical protein